MSIYPDVKQCVSILNEAGCARRVIVHSCTVRTIARKIAERFDVDVDLIDAGAMLHDIGRARDHSIFHAMAGADMAKELGLPPELVDIIKKHTGAGLDQEDVIELGLPEGDYIPRTAEEKIVAHADNLVSDDRLVPHTFSSEKLRRKGSFRGADRIEGLHRELSGIYGKDLDIVVKELGEYPKMDGPCSLFGK